jgi:hypothetical protein
VLGVLQPSGELIVKAQSTDGQQSIHKDPVDDQRCLMEVVWDGAKPLPLAATPIGFLDEEGRKPIYREHSKGMLLGDYQIKGDMWEQVRELESMTLGFKGEEQTG